MPTANRMTPTEMVERWTAALATQEWVRLALADQLEHAVSGDPIFETLSSVGGATYTAQHALGMLRELEAKVNQDQSTLPPEPPGPAPAVPAPG